MRKAGQVFIGVMAWAMMLGGGALAIGLLAMMAIALFRDKGEWWRGLREGDFESYLWLMVGLVPAVVGGLVFWAGVCLLRVFDRIEDSPEKR